MGRKPQGRQEGLGDRKAARWAGIPKTSIRVRDWAGSPKTGRRGRDWTGKAARWAGSP
jgi:hypothetical protein